MKTLETNYGRTLPGTMKDGFLMKRLALPLFSAVAALLIGSFSVQAQDEHGKAFVPVTAEALANPAPADWPMHRRTYDMWGYSPLEQIGKDNVNSLTLAWSLAMTPGINEATPLVYDGVMYLPNPNDVIYALDATTGDFLWTYRRNVPSDAGILAQIQRNIAIYDDKIYAAAADGYMYALDARSGQLVWETAFTDDYRKVNNSAGPIVADGKVISGHACSSGVPDGCYITAHDALSGEELWRTHVIARPGEPGGDTWGGIPLESRHHVNAWNVGAYDPELNLVYWGTSVPAPSPEILRGTGDAPMLYSNSTLAIDAETGEIAWYFQHLPRDNWDFDHTFERLLVDTVVAPNADAEGMMAISPDIEAGKSYKVMTGSPGKTGIVWTLDRETGKFLWAKETTLQNVITAIDPATGAVTINEDVIPKDIYDSYGMVCPAQSGGKGWQPSAYNPATNAMYLPLQNLCGEPEIVVAEWTVEDGYGLGFRYFLAPGEDKVGHLEAVSAETGETLWTFESAGGRMAVLTTGGGLVFSGTSDRRFQAHDADNGELLWETILGAPVSGHPVSYSVDDTQYIAIPVGGGDFNTPGYNQAANLTAPSGSNTVYVFKLPGN
jgi:alcohol dehydrogenase (cytochrome c)